MRSGTSCDASCWKIVLPCGPERRSGGRCDRPRAIDSDMILVRFMCDSGAILVRFRFDSGADSGAIQVRFRCGFETNVNGRDVLTLPG